MPSQVLITQKMLKSCESEICEKFDATRLYEQKDPERFLRDNGKEFRAIAGYGVDVALMDRLPNLKMIANFGVGYDGIDIKAAAKRSIAVSNTPDVLNDAMAEITIGLMICLSRKIIPADNFVRKGKWTQSNFPLQSEIKGKVAGIVGLGRIGKEIALRCEAMKMQVVYFGRTNQKDQPYQYFNDLVKMAENCDWLIVATPGGKETNKMVDASVLDALGKNGFLVNIARGSVVDEISLVKKLEQGELAGAGLDVFDDEPNVPPALFEMDNVILSPHQGSATRGTRNAMGQLLVANLDAFFAGKPLLTKVV
ncbi:D-3-phosphoglycerate dehydrogenase [hydrothermal vent metagenome]|uniref:D-3-phosphoglycerate dehydrogenase n=1 Tax=hydrothermal vent metagenome TaxID=652676 RepID=A0A3B0TXK5_9ZZZZ